jgi:NitT/TauT family transport system permease protein
VASGLGSFIAQATTNGNYHEIMAGLLVMSLYVSGLNALLWRRMYAIAETKFSLS